MEYKMSADEKVKELARIREKALHDEATEPGAAERRGEKRRHCRGWKTRHCKRVLTK
ncbi:MAG: hypothetical protein NC078_12895 [Ruminococcus sp.]|nr:hypothetical protein [Ruminococcus sp.]